MKNIFRVFILTLACASIQLCAGDDILAIIERAACEEEQKARVSEQEVLKKFAQFCQSVVQQSPEDKRVVQNLYTDPAARGSYEDVFVK